MRRLLPPTLFAELLAILIAGLALSYFASTWIFAADRQAAVRSLGGFAATQRIANLARLIADSPPLWRARIVAAASEETMRIALSAAPPPKAPSSAAAKAIRAALAAELPPALGRGLVVSVRGRSAFPAARQPMMHAMPMMEAVPAMATMMGDLAPWRLLDVGVRLGDGEWLRFAATLPQAAAPAPWQLLAALAVMAAVVLAGSLWALRRVTAPLGILVGAAGRFGRDIAAPPVAEAGSLEMRHAARAFNDMQARLQRMLAARTRLLAALSHDLRTPLTLLRLRTEALAEGEERERMLGSIGDLEAMIEASLALARGESESEPKRRLDLAALVEAIADDMAEASLPVRLLAADPVVIEGRPLALRGAITNLIDNAVKYGGAAEVRVCHQGETAKVVVEDRGPGIAEAERERVFEPFYRLDPARGEKSAGAGLGLAIARAAALAHGGEVILSDRPGGGLKAELSLSAGGARPSPPALRRRGP